MYNMQDKLPVRLDSAEMEIVIAAIGQNNIEKAEGTIIYGSNNIKQQNRLPFFTKITIKDSIAFKVLEQKETQMARFPFSVVS